MIPRTNPVRIFIATFVASKASTINSRSVYRYVCVDDMQFVNAPSPMCVYFFFPFLYFNTVNIKQIADDT